jgi:hypothetical protein
VSCRFVRACPCLASRLSTSGRKFSLRGWLPQRSHHLALAQPRRHSTLAVSKLDFPRDPLFLEKAAPLLDLYQGVWQGLPLGPQDFVFSADEKPSMQARRRKHPSLPPTPAIPLASSTSKGAWVYLAAWDVRRAKIFGRCARRNGIQPFDSLIAEVMDQEPYGSAKRVFWITDNCSVHRGQKCVQRLQARWPSKFSRPTISTPWPNGKRRYWLSSNAMRSPPLPSNGPSLGRIWQS